MIFLNHDLEHITGLIKPERSEKSWGDFKGDEFCNHYTCARIFGANTREEVR